MKKVILMILDGFGISKYSYGNAIKKANTKTIDYLMKNYPNSRLKASGTDVGLPKGQMGNSEVGHLNIGAGRIVEQDLIKINNSIKNKSFFKNEKFLAAIENCKKNDTNLHLIGLVSDGGIHSHIDHLIALLKLCKKENFTKVYIHAILDGRDTKALGNIKYIDLLQKEINKLKVGKIATISGRYYPMNRDKNYELTKLGYNAIANGIGVNYARDYKEAFELEKKESLTDEFMKPTVILENEKPIITVKDNDSIIAFNYRSDRMMQLTDCFTNELYNIFDREYVKTYYVSITNYSVDFKNVVVAFPRHDIKNSLGEVVSNNNLKQIRITENEKFAHVTYYFNGENDFAFKNEERVLLPRKNVFTYDEYPPMSSEEIKNQVIGSMNEDYSLIVVNFANGDALGHTGNFSAAVTSIEYLDKCINEIYEEAQKMDIELVITADHGNVEHMINNDGTIDKSHTTNLVPFIICNKKYKLQNGKLADIAPTILQILDLKKPNEMNGKSLIIK